MTLDQAKSRAKRMAPIMGQCYYVLGPFTGEEYVAIAARMRVELYPDRGPLFTAAPDGRTSTP